MGVLRGYVNYVAGFERITGMSSDTQDIDTRLDGLSVHDLRDERHEWENPENYPSRERTASREAIRVPRADTTGGGGSDVSDQV